MDTVAEQLRDPITLATAAAACLVALLGYRFYANTFNYWKRRGIPGQRSLGFAHELFLLLFKSRNKEAVGLTRKLGKLHGVFMGGRPLLVIADPEVLRQMAIKDFHCFQNHSPNEWANRLERNFIPWLQGDHWKRVRAMMSVQFTSNKMRRMHKLLDACGEDLLENFRERLIWARRDGQSAATVDLFATYSLYTMDAITSCCYGLKLQRERGDLDIASASARNVLVRDCNRIFAFSMWRFALAALLPRFLLRAFGFEMLPERTLMPMMGRVQRLIERRRQGAAPAKHDDLLQMLVDANLDDELELDELDEAENHHAGLTHSSLQRDQHELKCASSGQKASRKRHKALATKLTDIEILSNALFLLAAGLDTTRSSMSTVSYFLAHHQDVQDRVFDELQRIAIVEDTPVGQHIRFDYESLTSCQYLDAVICESLRMFGPASYTDRVASCDYHIEKYNVTVPKGSTVLYALHSVANDPDYWERPDRFEPDRFMPGRREQIVPGSYVPFGLGPRHCVAMRFSLTETKLGLAKVLMSYKFAPAPGTKYPPEPPMGSLQGASPMRISNCKVLVTYRDEAKF